MLAFETMPNKLEAKACIELLDEEKVKIPSWICFSSVDGENAPSGESFKECLAIVNKSDKVKAVGINCTSPHFIEGLIHEFKENFNHQSKFICGLVMDKITTQDEKGGITNGLVPYIDGTNHAIM